LPENVVYHLVVGALGSDVSHVIVDGRLVVEDGQIRTVDEQAAKQNAFETISRLWEGARQQ
jgi:cytosine/adenosine deaminase-related metal-dependent hydrolase